MIHKIKLEETKTLYIIFHIYSYKYNTIKNVSKFNFGIFHDSKDFPYLSVINVVFLIAVAIIRGVAHVEGGKGQGCPGSRGSPTRTLRAN